MTKEDKINVLTIAINNISSGNDYGMCIAIKNACAELELCKGKSITELIDEFFPKLWAYKPVDYILFWFDLQEPGKLKRIAILNELITNLNKEKDEKV